MSKSKIYEEICIGFSELENFKYTYKEMKKFIEEVKKKKNKKEKKEDINLKKYQEFIIMNRKKGYDIETTLKLWDRNKIDLLKY